MNRHAIDYIEFPARDLNKVKAFYQDAFGWTFTDYGPNYTSFNDGRLDGGFSTDATPGQGALVILYAENLEETKRVVEDCGGTVVRDIFAFPGGRRFHFTDPAGNELAVWSDK